MESTNLCKCNQCNAILIDTNPQVNAPLYSINGISNLEELVTIDDMKACPNCETDGYLNDNVSDDELPTNIIKLKTL